MISAANRELYIDWMLASSSPELAVYESEPTLREWMETDFDETVSIRIESDRHVHRYRNSCPVERASYDDYRLREVTITEDLTLLAGIHFLGLNVARPFVGVYGQTRALRDNEYEVASRTLLNEFSVFEAPAVWWWRQTEPRPSREWTPDQRVWLGRIERLLSTTISPGVGRDSDAISVTLGTSDDLDRLYPLYAGAYEEIWESDPRWRGRLQRSERSDLEACAKAGGLGIASVGGREAGLIAALPDRVRGVPGWEMIEEILFREFRGKGYARKLQRGFLRRLDEATSPWVVGTIDTDNIPSRRTAESVGRKDAGGWSFHTPAS